MGRQASVPLPSFLALSIFSYLLVSAGAASQSTRVCIVPHSHTDPGWKRTFEVRIRSTVARVDCESRSRAAHPDNHLTLSQEYHEAAVQHILRNTLLDLQNNPSHRFVWSETSYLHRWLTSLPRSEGTSCWVSDRAHLCAASEWRTIIRRLLAQKQLEFVGGGWVQHDEALVTPYAALSQMGEGLRWLRATFDANVDIGYQIDPFGHSALTPVVFRALGFCHAGTRSPYHTCCA